MAARDEALLQLRRTTIESPLDGIVSKRPVPGIYATAGVPIMVVVADTDLWIEANFKETELTLVRPGQQAIIKVDTYPDAECTGKVASISQATGAEFAVLPPQNASGNWVKVVQRIPVRIAVACREGDPPLVGMSTTVEIDTGHSRSIGSLLAGLGKSLGLSSASATAKP
jgi:membrane fusion protein (multidrug efflux system)